VPEDPAVGTAVKKQYLAWQAGKVDRNDFSAEMNKGLPDGTVARVASQLQSLGAATRFTYVERTLWNGNRVYTYRVETAKAKLRMLYTVDAAGKITALWFRPAR
jgi:hypothetical protein